MLGRPPPHRFHKHILTTCCVLGLSWELALSWALGLSWVLGLSWELALSWALGLSWVLGLCPRHSFQGLVLPCSHIPWATRVKPLILFFISKSFTYLAVLGDGCSVWDLQSSLWHADS